MIVVIVVGSLLGLCICFIVVIATRTGMSSYCKSAIGTEAKKKMERNEEQDELDAMEDLKNDLELNEQEKRQITPEPLPQTPSKKKVRIGGQGEEEVDVVEVEGGVYSPFPKPNVELLKMIDPRSRKQDIGVLGFSDGYNFLGCDTLCRAKYLGNCFDLEPYGGMELEAPCQPGHFVRFKNAEAAFCALKFWNRAAEFSNLSGEEAIKHMGTIVSELGDWKDPNNAGFGNDWNAMLAVLEAKYEQGSQIAQSLLDTGDAFLLYHVPTVGDEDSWSDNFDGSGANWLGLQLMLIRDKLASTHYWTKLIRRLINVETGDPWSKLQEDHWREAVVGAADVVEGASAKTRAMAGIVGTTTGFMTNMIIRQSGKKKTWIL